MSNKEPFRGFDIILPITFYIHRELWNTVTYQQSLNEQKQIVDHVPKIYFICISMQCKSGLLAFLHCKTFSVEQFPQIITHFDTTDWKWKPTITSIRQFPLLLMQLICQLLAYIPPNTHTHTHACTHAHTYMGICARLDAITWFVLDLEIIISFHSYHLLFYFYRIQSEPLILHKAILYPNLLLDILRNSLLWTFWLRTASLSHTSLTEHFLQQLRIYIYIFKCT